VVFIPFMLCDRLTDVHQLEDRRYVAEPKLDGQRAQLHVAGRRAVACYSRRKLDLLRHPGMAWLKEVEWPVEAAILDGEVCAGDGHLGVHAVLEHRRRPSDAMSLLAFDLLAAEGREIIAEPWRDRHKRLEDLVEGRGLPRVGLVPVSDDPPRLYETWVGWGGEGIVLKDVTSPYRPGVRSPAWLKAKPKLQLEVLITGGSAERIPWGDWGAAVMLDLAYTHPRTGKRIEIRQAVRVARDRPFLLRVGQAAELVCWGVMPSGMLRHPLFVTWLGDPATGG
jgi:ATP-dependent DNA ligase